MTETTIRNRAWQGIRYVSEKPFNINNIKHTLSIGYHHVLKRIFAEVSADGGRGAFYTAYANYDYVSVEEAIRDVESKLKIKINIHE